MLLCNSALLLAVLSSRRMRFSRHVNLSNLTHLSKQQTFSKKNLSMKMSLSILSIVMTLSGLLLGVPFPRWPSDGDTADKGSSG